MANTNDRQKHEWRDGMVARWSGDFEFVDPTREIVGEMTTFEAKRGRQGQFASARADRVGVL